MSAALSVSVDLADGIDRTHRLLNGLDPAEATANRTGQPPPPRLETFVRHILELDLDIDAGAEILDIDRIDLVGRGDDAFGELKPSAKSSKSAGVAIITAWVVPA